MTVYVNDSGTWRAMDEIHVNNSGTWEEIDNGISVNDSGTWRTVHGVPGSWVRDSAGSYTFTVPDGVHVMYLSAAGAGGGAGGAYYSTPGWGGAGGGYVDQVEIHTTPGNTISVNIGSGGGGVEFGDYGFYFSAASSGGNTTLSGSGLVQEGNVTSSTITLEGGDGGAAAQSSTKNDAYTDGEGGSTAGISGGTDGTDSNRNSDWGWGGASLGGTCASGYGTGPYEDGCSGVDGDDSRGCPYAAGKGTGGGGTDDISGCGSGRGGDGSDGYVKFEWGSKI